MSKTIAFICATAFVLLATIIQTQGKVAGPEEFPSGLDEPYQHWSIALATNFRDGIAFDGVQTSSGNFIIAGTLAGSPNDAVWLAMFAPDGSLMWEKTYDPGSESLAFSVRETTDLGFIVSGRTNGGQAWIMKIEAGGTIEWQMSLSTFFSEGSMAIETSGGDFMLAGTIENDYWVVRFDDSGNLIWQKSYSRDGGGSFDAANSIVETEDGGFVVSGVSGGPATTWLFKIDGSGDTEWQKHLSAGSGTFKAEQMIMTAAGDLALAGSTEIAGSGDEDFWVLKLAEDGSVLWQKSIDVNDSESARSISEMPGGDLVIAGSTSPDSQFTFGWMGRLTANGDLLWQKMYASGEESQFNSVAPTQDGGIFAAGTAAGNINVGSGIWMVRSGPNGEIDGCATVVDTAGTVANTAAGTTVTTVSPVVTTDSVTTPLLTVSDIVLGIEVFCSDYAEPANRPYWVTNFGDHLLGEYEYHFDNLVAAADEALLVIGSVAAHNSGQGNAWVMKIGSDSEIIWQVALGNGEHEGYSDAVTAGDAGIYLVGSSETGGDTDGLLTKLNPNGTVLWHKTYGGSGADGFSSSIQLSSGDLVLFGGTNSSGAGDWNLWLVKTDLDGNMVWEYTYGGNSFNYSQQVIEADNGDLVVLGRTDSFGAGDFDSWLLRLDPAGNVLWQKTLGGSETDRLDAVIETANQDLVLAGRTNSFGSGSTDGWVVRLNSAGSILWQKVYGNNSNDNFTALLEDGQGDLIIAGSTRVDSDTPKDNDNGWLLKLAPDGSLVWDTTIGGLGFDFFYSLTMTANGDIAAGGVSKSPMIDDDLIDKALVVIFDSEGHVCGCQAQVESLGIIGANGAAVVSNTGAVRQSAASTVAIHTIAVQSFQAAANNLCYLNPIMTATATPTAAAATATPTPTPTTTPPGLDYDIYLPVITR